MRACTHDFRYADAIRSSECKPCEVGRYASSVGQKKCSICPAGQYSAKSGAEACDLWYIHALRIVTMMSRLAVPHLRVCCALGCEWRIVAAPEERSTTTTLALPISTTAPRTAPIVRVEKCHRTTELNASLAVSLLPSTVHDTPSLFPCSLFVPSSRL